MYTGHTWYGMPASMLAYGLTFDNLAWYYIGMEPTGVVALLLRRGGDVLSTARHGAETELPTGASQARSCVCIENGVAAPTTEHGWMATGSAWSRESRSAQRSPVQKLPRVKFVQARGALAWRGGLAGGSLVHFRMG